MVIANLNSTRIRRNWLLFSLFAGVGALVFFYPKRTGRDISRPIRASQSYLERLSQRIIRGLDRIDRVLKRAEQTSDKRLIQKVKTHIGRFCSRPDLISVQARSGTVTLIGPILRSEADFIVSRVKSIDRVKKVKTHFVVQESFEQMPASKESRMERRHEVQV